MKLSQTELLKILAGTECSFCEKEKLSGCMFCDECWNKLSQDIRNRICHEIDFLSRDLKTAITFLEDGK